MASEVLREQRRSASIRLYGLDGAADPTDGSPGLPDLDEIVALTRETLGVEGAGVNLLVDDTQVTVASTAPLPPPMPRDRSICSAVVTSASEPAPLLEVPDLRLDPRFRDNPFVNGDQAALRFYAAAPLRGKHNIALGTLCVWDPEPQTLDERGRAALRTFGRATLQVLDERRRSLVPTGRGALRTGPIRLRSLGA